MSDEQKLTFGETAVGFSFNSGQNKKVELIKREFADVIDLLNDHRARAEDGEVKRMFSVAITEAQTAQMWAVKAVTWGLN
jgi:hypothetical protein